jgi:hypothetical protein
MRDAEINRPSPTQPSGFCFVKIFSIFAIQFALLLYTIPLFRVFGLTMYNQIDDHGLVR